MIEDGCDAAVVIDEAGNLTGVLTIKEIFEKLLGDPDDADQSEEITALSPNRFRISGSISLVDFNSSFDQKLQAKNAETLAGYLIERLDGFPRSKTILEQDNLRFSLMKMHEGRIHSVVCEILK